MSACSSRRARRSCRWTPSSITSATSDTDRNGVRNPSLWRIIGAGAPQELIEGIEAMQILYGEDTDGDRLVNAYVKADAVTNWNNVISVTFAMLIRSVEPNAPETDTRTYTAAPRHHGGPVQRSLRAHAVHNHRHAAQHD